MVALNADTPPPVARRHDLGALADADGAWLIVPDPDGPGRTAALDRALAGATGAAGAPRAPAEDPRPPAGLGPTVPPAAAARSLRWARLALALAREGSMPPTGCCAVTSTCPR